MAKILYHQLAKYHDLLTQRDYKRETELLVDVFCKYGFSIESVLDLACGTGMHMKYLEKKRFRTTGLDISTDMLDVAHANSVKSELILGDVVKLKLSKTYDAGIFMGTSFNYLIRDSDFIKLIDSLYNKLNQLLILDSTNFMNRDNLKEYKNLAQKFENSEVIFNSLRSVFFKNGLRHLEYHHTIVNKSTNEIQEFDDEAIGRAYIKSDLVRLTKDKFELIDSFGDYNINIPFSPSSRRIVAVFRKLI